MPKAIIFISLNLFFAAYFTGTASGQNKNDDSKSIKITAGKNILFDIDNETHEYLASDIERDLLGLNVAGDPNTKLFHTVVGLNFLLNGYSESERIVIKGELYDKNDYSDQKTQPSKQLLTIYNSVLDQLKDVQYFLQIKINSLSNGILGIEFTLYQMFDSGTFDYKKLNPLKHRAISFHINLNNDDYKSIMRMNLRQLFYEANSKLAPYILYNNNVIKDSVYVPIGNIELQGNSGAPDSSPDGVRLHWHLDCEECPTIAGSGFAQTVNFYAQESHRYYVKLTATDEHDTVSTTCLIIATKRPLIDLYLQLGADFSKSDNGYAQFVYFNPELRMPILQAGREQTLLRVTYNGDVRMIEPYSLKYLQKRNGEAREYLYVYNCSGGNSAPGIRCFIPSGFSSIENTDEKFEPRNIIELSKAGEFAEKKYLFDPNKPALSSRRQTSGFGRIGKRPTVKYVYQCTFCGKQVTKTHRDPSIGEHKNKNGFRCSGRRGFYVTTKYS